MTNAFTAIIAYITDHLAPFLVAEPVVYFTATFLAVWVIALVARLIGGEYTGRR